jgi:hypothetical protein
MDFVLVFEFEVVVSTCDRRVGGARGGPRQRRPIITVGPYTPGATPFVVPIVITGAVDLTTWQFDLAFDPTDLQVNTNCDGSTDAFCDPIFGPVTEGSFTSSGGTFLTLFVPGVVDNVTGLVSLVAGAFLDLPPGPSGSGVLANIEFKAIGTGTSPITVRNPSTTPAVPEPATVTLLIGGLALLGGRRVWGRRQGACGLVFAFMFAMVGALMAPSEARAQTTANGPYYATPSWDQKLPCDTKENCPRFVVLANWNNEAVLDRDTGLVWEQSPQSDPNVRRAWADAFDRCLKLPIGNRLGWRLPTIHELSSLTEAAMITIPGDTFLRHSLPAGHPFTLSNSVVFWSVTPLAEDTSLVWILNFPTGLGPIPEFKIDQIPGIWCVRTGSPGLGAQ